MVYLFIHQIDDKRQALPLEHLNLETESSRRKAKPGRTLEAGVISSFTSETMHSSSLLVISASHSQTLKVTKCYLGKLQPIVISNGLGGHGQRHVLHKNSVSELLQVEHG